MIELLKKFRDEEQEHHDIGLEEDAELAPAYELLTFLIKQGCKIAINVSEKIWKMSWKLNHTDIALCCCSCVVNVICLNKWSYTDCNDFNSFFRRLKFSENSDDSYYEWLILQV